VPPRPQLEADFSVGSEEGDDKGKITQGIPESSGASSWLPPIKKDKQRRKGVGGGWFGGAGEAGNVSFPAEAGREHGEGINTGVDEFATWGGEEATFHKRKPRSLDGLGFRSAATAASPSIPKVNTHFISGTGVSSDECLACKM
jgi:hypothetical protein